MKNSSRAIILIIVVLVIIIGVGLYFKMAAAKKVDENIKNVTTSAYDKAKEAMEQEQLINAKFTKQEIAAFSENDLKVDFFKLGESAKALEAKNYSGEVLDSYLEEATGKNITRVKYASLGLVVDNATDENNADGSMVRIEISSNSKLETARGIKIGSTKAEVMTTYPGESILENDAESSNMIIVGYPGDEPIYEGNHGKIYFHLENDKVVKIVLAYAIAE